MRVRLPRRGTLLLGLGAASLAGLCGVGGLAGCATTHVAETTEAAPGTARFFGGKRVVGPFVSPSAYEAYLSAQSAALAGLHDLALEFLARAITSDGTSAYLRTRLGEELLALGRIDEAREAFETAARFEPDFAEAHVGLGRIALRLGDGKAAEDEFQKALAIDRSCEEAFLALASLHRERGDLAQAEQVLRALIASDPGSPRAMAARLALARAAIERGEFQAAEKDLRQAADSPSAVEAHLELGRLLIRQERLPEAVAELRASYDRTGHDPRVAELLIEAELASGQADDADAILEHLDRSGGPRERRITVGWMHLARRHAARALAIADEVLASGDSSTGRLLRGQALGELGRTDEAVAELSRVPADSPDYPRARYRIGRLLLAANRPADAATLVGEAFARYEGKEAGDGLAALLSQIAERGGDRLKAAEILERARKARPGSDLLAFALGAVLERGGEWERAVEVVREVLAKNPDNVEALNFAGWVWTDHGARLPDAQKALERALTLRPTSGEVADSLGWLYFKLGRLDDASRLLERAERLLPESADVLHHVGDLALKRGDKDHAAQIYRRALALHPDEKQRHAIEASLLQIEKGRMGSR